MSEGKNLSLPEAAVQEKKDATGIRQDIYGETVVAEAACDYTLPDYLPEIRKILSLRAQVLPAGRYESGKSVEFAGTVAHTVLYADGEGKLQSLPLHADYSFTVQMPSDEMSGAVVDTMAEGTVCRLGGPRKISLRTRLSSHVHLFARESVMPEIRGMGSERDQASLETLSARLESMTLACGHSQEMALSTTIRLDSTGENTRTVFTGGGVLANECRAEAGACTVRGEVFARVLCVDGEGSPYVLRERIPFESRIEIEGVREGDSCTANGRITAAEASITPGDGEENGFVTLDLTIEVEAYAMGTEICEPMTALYSTAYEMTCHNRELTYHRPLGCAMGHYTVTASRARGECDGESAAAVVDADGRVELGAVTVENGRAVVSGRLYTDLIFTNPPEGESVAPLLLSAPISCPFRIESNLRVEDGANPSFACHAELISARGRIEQNALAVDGEIAITLRAYETKRKTVLADAEPAESLPDTERGERLFVVYPKSEDSLFSVAARYHKKRAAVARANGLSEAAQANSASPSSLDGIHHLLIED